MTKKTTILAICVSSGAAATAFAQPYYVRGEFEFSCMPVPAVWENNCEPMVQIGPNKYETVVIDLFPGAEYEFKATVDDWSLTAPGSNAKAAGDDFGELHVYLYDTETHGDGWMPEGQWRLGYEDSLIFGWELVGAMNNWDPQNTDWYLTDMGNGLHVGEFTIDPGTYEWKFRQQGNWSISIGDDFGNSAGNNSITVTGNDPIKFELDLPGGRWRVIDENACYPDCDTSTGPGVLDIFDFLCFQDDFVNGGSYSCDCDTSTGPGVCDIFDFLCFQGAFVDGCP